VCLHVVACMSLQCVLLLVCDVTWRLQLGRGFLLLLCVLHHAVGCVLWHCVQIELFTGAMLLSFGDWGWDMIPRYLVCCVWSGVVGAAFHPTCMPHCV